MSRISRREAMGTLIAGSVVAALVDVTKGGEVMAEETSQSSTAAPQPAPAYRGANQIKPLPFEASKLKGLSEKLIPSHHQNNYSGTASHVNRRTVCTG
jgi:superoxide dismutase, Fe-Mn family